uniref:Putative Protease inhibitor n=1 Tax=Megacormus gertschi TaxID=1843536 RepID=A0A224XFK9_9SCOR
MKYWALLCVFATLIFCNYLQSCTGQRNRLARTCDRLGEVFKSCGTACPLTCDNYRNPPKYCTRNCVIGCACRDGFVRDRNRRCVNPSKC